MSKIIEVHRTVNNNVGDMYCNPSRYFNLGEVSTEELVNNKSSLEEKTLVIGGGGLIHKKFQFEIEQLLNKNPSRSVIWGIGHNFGPRAINKGSIKYYPDWIKKCNLVGIRDYIPGHLESYLPCVSCMHPAFDKTYKVKHNRVYFLHRYKTVFNNDTQLSMYNNETDFDKVIKFLGQAKTIVTDSYHGAYWGQLLGKNVQVASWSVKFNHMKYPPAFIKSINEQSDITSSVPTTFLEECRTLNRNFYNKFLDL